LIGQFSGHRTWQTTKVEISPTTIQACYFLYILNVEMKKPIPVKEKLTQKMKSKLKNQKKNQKRNLKNLIGSMLL
jgi:hypothetical protein